MCTGEALTTGRHPRLWAVFGHRTRLAARRVLVWLEPSTRAVGALVGLFPRPFARETESAFGFALPTVTTTLADLALVVPPKGVLPSSAVVATHGTDISLGCDGFLPSCTSVALAGVSLGSETMLAVMTSGTVLVGPLPGLTDETVTCLGVFVVLAEATLCTVSFLHLWGEEARAAVEAL